MTYRLVIFDFDGTLADSFPFFMGAFNEMAQKHGFKTLDAEEVPRYRHYTARQLMKHVGMPMWKLPAVAKSFITLMNQKAAGIPVFDGVRETLKNLNERGVVLAVVTSNSAENVQQILGPETMTLIRYMECGMSMFGKQASLKQVLKQSGIPVEEAIYIGDQVSDLEGARKAKLAFGAVSWGYGTLESLQAHGPEEVFEDVREFESLA